MIFPGRTSQRCDAQLSLPWKRKLQGPQGPSSCLVFVYCPVHARKLEKKKKKKTMLLRNCARRFPLFPHRRLEVCLLLVCIQNAVRFRSMGPIVLSTSHSVPESNSLTVAPNFIDGPLKDVRSHLWDPAPGSAPPPGLTAVSVEAWRTGLGPASWQRGCKMAASQRRPTSCTWVSGDTLVYVLWRLAFCLAVAVFSILSLRGSRVHDGALRHASDWSISLGLCVIKWFAPPPLFFSISVWNGTRKIMEGIRALTFHCSDRSRKTCTHVGLLCPSTKLNIQFSLRWQIKNSWNLHSPASEAGGGCGHVHPCCRLCHSPSSPSKTKFACGQQFRLEQRHHHIDRGEDLREVYSSPTNNLLLDLCRRSMPDQLRERLKSRTMTGALQWAPQGGVAMDRTVKKQRDNEAPPKLRLLTHWAAVRGRSVSRRRQGALSAGGDVCCPQIPQRLPPPNCTEHGA